jgi:thiamine biosynthesis lipoprotein
MIADAWATALMVLGPEAGLELAAREQIAAVFLLKNNEGIEEIRTAHFDRIVLTTETRRHGEKTDER